LKQNFCNKELPFYSGVHKFTKLINFEAYTCNYRTERSWRDHLFARNCKRNL